MESELEAFRKKVGEYESLLDRLIEENFVDDATDLNKFAFLAAIDGIRISILADLYPGDELKDILTKAYKKDMGSADGR